MQLATSPQCLDVPAGMVLVTNVILYLLLMDYFADVAHFVYVFLHKMII